MSYESREESRYQGQPLQLYIFRYGENSSFRYTDAPFDVVYDDGDGEKTYKPIPISRSKITASGTLDKAKLEIRLLADSDIGEFYKLYPPNFTVTLTILSGHYGETDFLCVWSGNIKGGGPEGSEVILTGEPISSLMKRNGLRRRYQYGCPHVLYGSQCRADKTAATQIGTVASYTAGTITLNSGWEGARSPAKFIGGYVEWENPKGNVEIRTIYAVAANVLKLRGYVRDIAVGQNVNVVLGCDHTEADCQNLHVETGTGDSNIVNFGGQPWIPLENPVNKNQNR